MKNLLFLALLSIGLFTSCKDDDQDPNTLPAATQSGANTGGALVNGEIWVAKIENPDLMPGGNNTQYQAVNGEYNMEIVLRNVSDSSGNIISIKINSNEDLSITDYELNDSDFNRGYYRKSVSYYTDSENTGILTITKFDKANKIISGTFSFKAKNQNGTVVNITEGRFDKKFVEM